jgi:hypothetical protein
MSVQHTTAAAHGRWRVRWSAALALAVAMCALAAGASAAQAATLTISRVTDPPGDPTPVTYAIDFTKFTAADPDTTVPSQITLAGGETKTFTDVTKGYYTVREQTPSGFTLVSIVCTADPEDTDPGDAFVIDKAAGQARIELSAQENKGCTFTDAVVPGPPPVITPPAPTPVITPPAPAPVIAPPTPRPQSAVKASRVARGVAHLQAPKRCVRTAFTVAVTGTRVLNVRWYVNGHYVKTVRAQRGQRRFTLRVKPGAARRIVARVTFVSGTAPRRKTLPSAVVYRCAPAVVRPKFTG